MERYTGVQFNLLEQVALKQDKYGRSPVSEVHLGTDLNYYAKPEWLEVLVEALKAFHFDLEAFRGVAIDEEDVLIFGYAEDRLEIVDINRKLTPKMILAAVVRLLPDPIVKD